MTQLQHIAWYNLVIANVYAVGGEKEGFYIFTLISLVCLVASYFERSR